MNRSDVTKDRILASDMESQDQGPDPGISKQNFKLASWDPISKYLTFIVGGQALDVGVSVIQ
jgi:hypothetical protein